MATTTEPVRSLDKLDKRILLALDEDLLSAKGICDAWALPESDEARVRYRIRERLGCGDDALVCVYRAEKLPGGISDRHIYSLTDAGAGLVKSNREELTTPESIDELREDLDRVDDTARAAGEDADEAMDVATAQRERINKLQAEKCTINDRSKENRSRVQDLEREVFAIDWDDSLSERIGVVEEASINRASDIEDQIERRERQYRSDFAKRSDLRDVQSTAQRASNVSQNASERINELKEALEAERARVNELERRLAAIERASDKPGGIMRYFYD
ncbi:hypothetical protein [Halogeometricum sp. CBA1124]|uniref:hypothetical protein n=1 Tax=Halogeometricum sp. CBA1124 TaxID=2668071 RepID=UPI00142BA457|nr:hypothetical protein [Halogeometricum sp. CBA1124]MUV56237.1 hypothetical protein [Halogeometricum sp. CBA1124]